MHIVVLCKRQYTNRDVIDDRYGRLWEIPAELAKAGHCVTCVSFSYATKDVVDKTFELGGGASVRWISVNLGRLLIVGLVRYLATLPFVLWPEHRGIDGVGNHGSIAGSAIGLDHPSAQILANAADAVCINNAPSEHPAHKGQSVRRETLKIIVQVGNMRTLVPPAKKASKHGVDGV